MCLGNRSNRSLPPLSSAWCKNMHSMYFAKQKIVTQIVQLKKVIQKISNSNSISSKRSIRPLSSAWCKTPKNIIHSMYFSQKKVLFYTNCIIQKIITQISNSNSISTLCCTEICFFFSCTESTAQIVLLKKVLQKYHISQNSIIQNISLHKVYTQRGDTQIIVKKV